MTHRTLIFAGPSAVGKTYVADALMERHPEAFEQAKLYTTRGPRLNENATDRVFLSQNKFAAMLESGNFIIHAEFGGNMYGFTRESLEPSNKHLLANTWPRLIPPLARMQHTIMIGMRPPEKWRLFLVDRMRARGDSEEVIAKRVKLIEKDLNDLEQYQDLVSSHGRLFTVHDNTTATDTIVPWIESKLGLKA